MPPRNSMQQSCLALAFILFSTTQTSAGIVVLDDNGIVSKFTPNTGPDIYFYQGSFTDNSSVIYDFTDSEQSVLQVDLGNTLKTYTTSTPNTTVTYVFANLTEQPASEPLVNVHNVYFTNHTTNWTWNAHPSFYPTKSATTNDPGGQGSKIIYWASTTAPDSSSVPEPSTAIAMGFLGIVGFAGNRRRRRQVSAA